VKTLPIVVAALLVGASGDIAKDFLQAVGTDNVARVKFLLESGADPNASYENGFTPICSARNPDVVDVLIAHGARVNFRVRGGGESPIELAAERYFSDLEHHSNWKTIVAKLRDAGAEYTIDTATYMNDVQFVDKRLAADSSWVNNRSGGGRVP
jgi:ankyrin repeat protein